MDTGVLLAVIAMVVVLIGMLVAKKALATSNLLQPVLFLCVALELGCLIYVFHQRLGGGSGKSVIEIQKAVNRSKGVAAAEFLKAKAPGKKVLFVCMPGFKEDQMTMAMLEGFQKTYGGTVVCETIDGQIPEDVMASDYLTPDKLNPVFDKCADAGLIIFCSGILPQRYNRLKAYGKAPFFLIDTGSADYAAVTRDLKAGKILGTIVAKRNTGLKHNSPVEKKDIDTFNKRFDIDSDGSKLNN